MGYVYLKNNNNNGLHFNTKLKLKVKPEEKKMFYAYSYTHIYTSYYAQKQLHMVTRKKKENNQGINILMKKTYKRKVKYLWSLIVYFKFNGRWSYIPCARI